MVERGRRGVNRLWMITILMALLAGCAPPALQAPASPSATATPLPATGTSEAPPPPTPSDEGCDYCEIRRTPLATESAGEEQAPSSPSPTTLPPTPTGEDEGPTVTQPPATETVVTLPPEPTPQETPTPEAPTGGSVAVWETKTTIAMADWEAALVPSTPDQPFYPYPALNFDAVGPISPRTYPAVVLENSYVRVTLLPQLGGRVLHWEDRVTGRRLTYHNPSVKVTRWGYRGWWLATGGIEWAFPTDEHGLNEFRPWQYQLLAGEGWRGVKVWDQDDRTGMEIAVTLRLYEGRSDLVIAPHITNPTAESQPFQFWMNAMLTLSDGNSPSAALTFWVPTETMMVHSTGDGSLPGPRSLISWPIYQGRDFSRYGEWRNYLGLFAVEARGAAGAYDLQAKQGFVRVYPSQIARGVKIFALGDLPANLYTEGGSRYFEFWGGYNRTFFPEDYATLAPGGEVRWEERWYPIHGIGGLDWASGDLALSLAVTGAGIEVGAQAPYSTPVTLTLLQHGQPQATWQPQLSPTAPFHSVHPGGGDGWSLRAEQGGNTLAEISP